MTAGAVLARAAVGRSRHDVARLLSLMDDPRPTAVEPRDAAIRALDADARERGHRCAVLGITGTPGSGKSSLLSVLTRRLLTLDRQLRIAVVAVDPSSPMSGGALLGDRVRMRTQIGQDRLYFRSQSAASALGGLAPSTFDVCRALSALVDVVLVETVGIGQSEADIAHLADRVYLVLAPHAGDDVQLLKAGIIEIPDAFVVNKCDAPAAATTYHQLKGTLWLARPFDAERIAVHRTSALRGDGIEELADAVLADIREQSRPAAGLLADRAPYFFTRWVDHEWGRTGTRHLSEQLGGAEAYLAGHEDLGAAQVEFSARLAASLAAPGVGA